MKTKLTLKWFEKTISLLIMLLFFLSSFAQEAKQQKEYHGDNAKQIIPEARYIQEGINTDYPTSVKFEKGSEIQQTQFLTWMKETFEISDDVDFDLKKTDEDDLGYIHYRYNQTYKGIPIDRAEYVVQSINGKVTSFRGSVFDIETVNTNASLSEQEALKKALSYLGDKNYLWESDYWENEIKERLNDPNATYLPEGKLILTKFGKSENEKEENEFRLAYVFDIYGASKEERVFIDAVSGEVIYTLPLASNCEPAVSFTSIFNGSRNIQTEKYTSDDYRLNDDCQSTEIWVRDWGSTTSTAPSTYPEIENTTNTWTTQDERFGATVLWETKQSYFYFKNVHSRSSFDGSNANLKCYINAVFSGSGGDYTDNASMAFNGSRMKVGLGSSGTLANSWSSMDIIAHEFTHAVTGTSSALVYQGESGALNESFSDIFGEMVENYAVGPNDWLMGDDRTNGAIRSMSNPKTYGDPDTYLGTGWKNTCGTCSDAGGVHTNSGVQNYWFFLVSEGGSGTNDNGDDYSVTGLGKSVASAIAFRNQVYKLGENSDYADARTGAIEAAEDLYGACSNAVKQVTNAWYAVGVGDPYVDVEITAFSDVSCSGAADGSITISAVGSGTLTYSWNDGPTTQNRTGLSGGSYTVTVTDATGCTASISKTINEPAVLIAAASATSDFNGYNISCYGLSDGEATASATGGTKPYSFLWDANAGSQSTAIASGLSVGTYWVTITDANGCVSSTSVSLTEPPLLSAAISDVSDYNGYNISCNGGSDGWATVLAGGGVTPYSYLWDDDDAQSTATATGLMAGTYWVIVTDANGCQESTSVTLTEPTPLTIEAGDNQTVYYGYPPAECAMIAWSGEGGGVPPYTISWNDGGDQSHKVCPGDLTTDYTVTITDANGCIEEDIVTICVIDVRCGLKLDKVEICHVPEDPSESPVTICVSASSVESHLLHGDMLASCGTDHRCPPDKSFNNIESFAYENQLNAYPNPFTQSTKITFSSATEGMVTLKLFDVTGREVKAIYEGAISAYQKYEVDVDASVLPSGVNYCIIQYADGSFKTQKLILTK